MRSHEENVKIYKMSTWHRGDTCNFYPNPKRGDFNSLTKLDIVEKFIVPGWIPPEPFITKNHIITAFGSCFAAHIISYLKNKGYAPGSEKAEAQIIRYGSGMANTFSIRQQFEWAYKDKKFTDDIWFANPAAPETPTLKSKQETRELLDRTDIFIITLGLSEVWYNKETGDVFWKAIPGVVFDPEKHAFRVSTCSENKDNLQQILSMIEEYRPGSTVIFTLSPVTLVCTFRPVSCITADNVSKSILRVAIDETLREYSGKLKLYYWPSYEIVKEFYPDSYDTDRRHVTAKTVSLIMDSFAKYFLVE